MSRGLWNKNEEKILNLMVETRRLQLLIQVTNSNTEKSFFGMFYDERFNLITAMTNSKISSHYPEYIYTSEKQKL